MAIFRKKNKLQLTHLRSTVVTAVYQDRDFPTIDLKIKVRDDDSKKGKRSDVTEITISMTLFEATELLSEFQLKVSNTARLYTPRSAINVPWGE